MNKNELKFRAIGIMADRDQDVRLSNTLVEFRSVKAGGLVTFGVDDSTGSLVKKHMSGLANTHIMVCLFVDAQQLDTTMKELTEPAKGAESNG
ncbi:hypothetical protein [Chitinophaga sp. LS1]|uniref:hypothetical protein n=1 Tax=Chitinophaga sp. LS1 TaxID=3051176 RepID=UPI002AAAA71D|nr:hypothetical protein [Chitinophaga sp. LS1]WPV66304.1 hypothetical protein QQL36_31390 [Chitinophaga sp. LS1]